MSEPKPMLKKYYSPTPKKWRKLGDGILGFTAALQVSLIAIEGVPKWIMIAVVVLGAGGKFLTNFFTEDAE